MVTASDQVSDRVKGFEAGADEFLTKPVSDVILIAQLRSLTRLKMVTDALRMRAVTSKEIGLQSLEREAAADAGRNGRILIVDDRAASYERLQVMLAGEQSVDIEDNPAEALFRTREGNYDLLIVSLRFNSFDGLRLQPGPCPRADPQLAYPGNCGHGQRRAVGPGPRDRDQCLPDASGRQE
jgi:two-component system cell cycle response regulator